MGRMCGYWPGPWLSMKPSNPTLAITTVLDKVPGIRVPGQGTEVQPKHLPSSSWPCPMVATAALMKGAPG